MTEQLKQQAISEQNARFAIDGAIAFGRQGINKPPSDDHWLMEYWQIGRSLAALDAAASEQQCGNTPYDEGPFKLESERNQALEEAAQVCEARLHRAFSRTIYAVSSCRDAIRALKDEQSKTAEPADSAQASERFYFDHGLWHDRATGRHLYTQDQYDQEKQAAFKDGYDKRNEELALAAQNAPAQPVVPEGWALVPKELTQAMRGAWDRTPVSEDDDVDMRNAYRAMIAAAPQGEQQS